MPQRAFGLSPNANSNAAVAAARIRNQSILLFIKPMPVGQAAQDRFTEQPGSRPMSCVKHIIMSLAFVSFAFLVGCSTSNVRDTAPGENPSVPLEEARSEVRGMANGTLRQLYATQPAARQAVESAAGYAVFSNFGMKILLAGGGTGEGLAVDNTQRREIFMRMAEVQAGLGFGVKKFRQVWVFDTQDAFDEFVNNGYQFGGQATLAAQTSGKGAAHAGAMSVSPGVWVYQITDDGLAAELTVKGTRYYRDNALN